MTNDGGATDMSKCCHVKAEFYVYNDATSVYDLVADPATTYCFISNFVSAAAAVNPASVGEITFEQAASDSCPDSYSPSAQFNFKVRIINDNESTDYVDFIQEFTYIDPCSVSGDLQIETAVSDQTHTVKTDDSEPDTTVISDIKYYKDGTMSTYCSNRLKTYL